MIRRVLAFAAVVGGLAGASPARSNTDSDRAAIVDRLQRWTAAFNAGDGSGICDLFAPDLVFTVPETLDGSRDVLCSRLDALLATPGLQLHYDSPDIREIIVSGNIAVVRLFWTLTARKGAVRDVSTEAGVDIFERDRDGRWSIARFVSFSITPNKVLQ